MANGTQDNLFSPTWQDDVRGNPKIISKAQEFKADLDDEVNTPDKFDKASLKYGWDMTDWMQLLDIGFYYRGTPVFDMDKYFKAAKK